MDFQELIAKARLSVGELDVFERAKEAQQRGPPPTYSASLPPPFLNRIGFVSLHDTVDMQKETVGVRTTMRSHLQQGPVPPIQSLRQTTLREIATRVNFIHEDCVLFAQTIHDAHRMVATNVLVEDSNNDCLMLSLYNLVPMHEEPNEYFLAIPILLSLHRT